MRLNIDQGARQINFNDYYGNHTPSITQSANFSLLSTMVRTARSSTPTHWAGRWATHREPGILLEVVIGLKEKIDETMDR